MSQNFSNLTALRFKINRKRKCEIFQYFSQSLYKRNFEAVHFTQFAEKQLCWSDVIYGRHLLIKYKYCSISQICLDVAKSIPLQKSTGCSIIWHFKCERPALVYCEILPKAFIFVTVWFVASFFFFLHKPNESNFLYFLLVVKTTEENRNIENLGAETSPKQYNSRICKNYFYRIDHKNA